MAGNVLIKNANGKTVTLQNPDTNNNDIVVDTSVILQRNQEKDLSYKSTPVSITSWSYVGTTITLNVASHSFVAGDYIEVSGLTATTYPANGVQLVSSVTATTIVFTLSATPTGTAGVSGATVKGYATINGRASESIGVNQTWQDVTASRSAGVIYTNSTGKPIEVAIVLNSSNAVIDSIQVSPNGTSWVTVGSGNNGVNAMPSQFIVPNNWMYKSTAFFRWSELR